MTNVLTPVSAASGIFWGYAGAMALLFDAASGLAFVL
jgi:hypothetical protein